MTIPKLSEAIRLGAMLKPQCTGKLMTVSGPEKTCALGAALDSIGAIKRERVIFQHDDDAIPALRYTEPEDLWPILRTLIIHPVDAVACDLQSVIISLNDDYLWTREGIADWVETIEKDADGSHIKNRDTGAVAAGMD